MASAEVNVELCSLGHKIYADTVTLKCGHNFCRICMENKLKEQDEKGFYTCPTCGKRFSSRPSLQKNRELIERVTCEQFGHPNSIILCMYCSLPAVKTCPQCVGSLCEGHLATHNEAFTHTLIDPTSLENRKCPVHNKLLDYYCAEDDVCICPDCIVLGDHKGHKVESLDEACKKKKEKMQTILKNLASKREDTKEKIRELSEHESREKEKAHLQEEQVIGLCKDLMEQIQKVERNVLKHTSHQIHQIEQSVQKQINTLKEHDQQVSTSIRSVEEVYKMDDPLHVLQNWKSGEESETPQKLDDIELPTFKEINGNRFLHKFNRTVSNLLKCLPTQHTSQIGLNGELSVQDNVSENSLENSQPNQINAMDFGQKHSDSTVVKIDPTINEQTFRLDIKSAGVFQCSKTKIKFSVTCPQTIEYTMDQKWSNRMPDNAKNRYEIIGPLFDITTSAGLEKTVHLPHSLSPKGFEINKPYLKCAHFDYGMFKTVLPSKVESSHVVLENTTHSSVGVLMDNSPRRKRKQALSRGTVLIYCKPETQCFSIHVYLVPMSKRQAKEVIEKKEIRGGFQWIDKPSFISSVSKHIKYNIHASKEVIIENEELHYLHSVYEQYPYAAIRVPDNLRTVNLHISEEGKEEKIWSCVLNKKDLYGNPGTSTCTSLSASGKGKAFIQKNHGELCNRLGILEPMLLSLREQGIIDENEEDKIRSEKLELQQRRALLQMVKKKGVEDKFYEILKNRDPSLVQSLEEQPNKG